MNSRRKVSPSRKGLFLKKASRRSIGPSSTAEAFAEFESSPNKENQEMPIAVNTPEAFSVEPISIIVDVDRNKKHSSRETVKFPVPVNKTSTVATTTKCDFIKAFRLFNTHMNFKDKGPVGCAEMTQPTIKYSAASNRATLIYDKERYLHECAQKFEEETNKENILGFKALWFYPPCSKCSGAEKIPYNVPLADLPPTLLDGILHMEEEYKAKQQEVLPDDLQGVTVDLNLFTGLHGLAISDFIDLYG